MTPGPSLYSLFPRPIIATSVSTLDPNVDRSALANSAGGCECEYRGGHPLGLLRPATALAAKRLRLLRAGEAFIVGYLRLLCLHSFLPYRHRRQRQEHPRASETAGDGGLLISDSDSIVECSDGRARRRTDPMTMTGARASLADGHATATRSGHGG